MAGELAILNVGAGDTKLVFDPSKPDEMERSATIVRDMIRRGFVLLIEVGSNEKGPIYQRAHDFDPATCEYVVAGLASDADQEEGDGRRERKSRAATPAGARAQASKARGKGQTRRIAAGEARAVGVSRTSGG